MLFRSDDHRTSSHGPSPAIASQSSPPRGNAGNSLGSYSLRALTGNFLDAGGTPNGAPLRPIKCHCRVLVVLKVRDPVFYAYTVLTYLLGSLLVLGPYYGYVQLCSLADALHRDMLLVVSFTTSRAGLQNSPVPLALGDQRTSRTHKEISPNPPPADRAFTVVGEDSKSRLQCWTGDWARRCGSSGSGA